MKSGALSYLAMFTPYLSWQSKRTNRTTVRLDGGSQSMLDLSRID